MFEIKKAIVPSHTTSCEICATNEPLERSKKNKTKKQFSKLCKKGEDLT